ncbi:hypothetical protein BRD01_00295 [Halobacteriales archaeon QS_8_65_32]|nr:MAG: hypothetical protein BRD01_00295 [Halobacteriales archaeon QS_8_65_32]
MLLGSLTPFAPLRCLLRLAYQERGPFQSRPMSVDQPTVLAIVRSYRLSNEAVILCTQPRTDG